MRIESGEIILFLESIISFDSFNLPPLKFGLLVNSSKLDRSFKIGSLFILIFNDSFSGSSDLFCSIEAEFSSSFNIIPFVFS